MSTNDINNNNNSELSLSQSISRDQDSSKNLLLENEKENKLLGHNLYNCSYGKENSNLSSSQIDTDEVISYTGHFENLINDDTRSSNCDSKCRTNNLRSFFNDICIPLKNNEYYEIDYEKFQSFCNKSPIVKKGSINKTSKPEENEDRIMFYSKIQGNNDNHIIQRSDQFQNIKIPGNESISTIMKNAFFWIDISNPTKEEINMLSQVFGIHPLTVEDIEVDDTREKFDSFINYYFLSVSSFEQTSYAYLQSINVSILVFKNCVLSFHQRPTPHPDNILKRLVQLSHYDFQITGEWIAYAHIDDIADSFVPLLGTIEIDVDSIDELVLILKESEQNDMLRRIGQARKQVTALQRLLTDKADVIKIFIKRLHNFSPKSETLLYLSDVQDHVITMVQNLSHYDKTLTRSHSNYLAQITIEITQAANRTNSVVMKMTALGSIFLPLNVITGMWGMNVTVPGQSSDTYTSFFPFFMILTLMIVISLSVILISKRWGML